MMVEDSRILHSITFEHAHRDIRTTLYVTVSLASAGNNDVDVKIDNEQGRSLGQIHGSLREEHYEKNFYALFSTNTQPKQSELYVPRAVSGSIAQLIECGFIDIWHSSSLLSEDAKDMYGKYLANRNGLCVAPPNPPRVLSYVVTRRK